MWQKEWLKEEEDDVRGCEADNNLFGEEDNTHGDAIDIDDTNDGDSESN